MKKSKIIKTGIIIAIAGIIVAGAVGYYLFNMPHRDVQSAKTDYSLNSSEIVAEYLSNASAANSKYLSSDGNSKILEITGVVSKVSEDFEGRKVVLLKNTGDKAGVSATFTPETNANAANLQIGQTVTLKGVIRSGAAYNEDLGIFENVILEKSNVVAK